MLYIKNKFILKKKGLLIIMLLFFMLLNSVPVYGADVIYSTDTIIDLSSPDINLTILSGSRATSVVVRAGDLVVTVPSSETFTITSADRALGATGASRNGVIALSCNDNLLQTLILRAPSAGPETITITPEEGKCSRGVTNQAQYGHLPLVTSSSISSSDNIIKKNNSENVSTKVYDFGTKTLKNGSKGEAVKELQRFLNANLNLGLVVDGKLGPKTIAVIKKWQKANGLVADGLMGAKTKAKMNSMAQ